MDTPATSASSENPTATSETATEIAPLLTTQSVEVTDEMPQEETTETTNTATSTATAIPQSPSSSTTATTPAAAATSLDAQTDGESIATAVTASSTALETSNAGPTPPIHAVLRGEQALLREWNLDSNQHVDTSTTDTTATTPLMMPPVAPAIVLNETSEGSTPGTPRVYSYPVATFVSNLVRSSVNELRGQVANHIYASAVPETVNEDTISAASNDPMSIRSAPGAMVPTVASHPPPASSQSVNASVASLDDDEGAEFLLIDGDLVAIPAISQVPSSHDTESDMSSSTYARPHRHSFHQMPFTRFHSPRYPLDQTRSQTDGEDSGSFIVPPGHANQQGRGEGRSNSDGVDGTHAGSNFTQSLGSLPSNAACRPNHSRMHRGMRKVKKWMKKKNLLPKRSAWKQQSGLVVDRKIPSSIHATGESELRDDSTIASSQQQQANFDDESLAPSIATSTDEASSPSRRKTKRKKGRLGRMADGDANRLEPTRQEDSDISTTNVPSVASAALPPSEAAASPLHAPPTVAAASLDGVASLDPLAMYPPTAASPQLLESPYGTPAPAAFATAETSTSHMSLDASANEAPSLNGSSLHRQASIAAEYVGNADQLLQAGVLPDSVLAAEAYIEDRLDDYDKYDKKDPYYMRSMVPRDADFKVDKLDAPCVEAMLRRAGEFEEDTESNEQDTPLAEAQSFLTATKGKSDGESVPLSMATGKDTLVHNDILKLVMVGDARVDKSALARAIRHSSKKPRKRTTLGVDVHSWAPPNQDNVKFTIWDVQGASSTDASPYDSNFGAHPGTQSLFFSDRSLYLLVWDLAASNRKTYRRKVWENDDSDDDEEEDDNEYLREEANRQADRALQADIEERVLSWVDCIARRGSHSAILPIALITGDSISPDEAKRRCDAMQTLMMEHTERMDNAPKVLSGAETVLCVSLDTNMGMDLLQETILAIATDASHSVFDHVCTPVPLGTTMVLETTRRLKEDHKLVLVDHLMAELLPLKGEMGMVLSVEQVMEALHFLASIGEVLYFGGMDDVLSHYVILSRKWMVSALSCILRNDLKRELMETRRFMNMQCLYSDQQFPENHVTQTFSANTSNCPLLSSTDTQMLWQSMSFMREAADKSSQLQENSTTSSTMFGFLEHLLVHTGFFLPLDIDRFASPDMVYFVPSLLAQDTSRDIWTYKSSESWMTTLAHSWLFRDGTPSGLMEHVTVALLRDLYEFSHIVAAAPAAAHMTPPHRSQTFPFAQNNLTDFMSNHDGDKIGRIKIHQMMCWKNSLLVKIGCVFPDGNELRESFAEIFVSIADPSSNHCVSSDAMRANMQRLIVSGKGQVGHHGRKLWKGGYNLMLDSIKASIADCTNVDRQVICPECLAHAHPSSASTWSWDSVRAAAETGSTTVRCMRGHRVDSNLICGTTRAPTQRTEGVHNLSEGPKKPVKDLLPSGVLVGLWDPRSQSVRNVGSGFIVDKKQGLIVTAGHILFEMEEGRQFGTPYFGLKNAKVVIGTIPEADGDSAGNNGGSNGNNNTASFRYFAEIVADDIHSMDACVLRITTRLEEDVDDEAQLGQLPEKVIDWQNEQLPVLKMTRRFELEETVRILGFNQAGEGWLEQGKHVNRSADFARGYICKQFKLADDGSESDSDDSSSSCAGFSPREEIVIMCPTIPGHSGGPCVNEEGRVVGILSRADPVDRNRCYLVPSSELKILVNKAKKSSSRVGGPKSIY